MASAVSGLFNVSIVAPSSGTSPDGTYLGRSLLPAGKTTAAQIVDAVTQVWTVTDPTDMAVASGQIGLKQNGVQRAASVAYAVVKTGLVYSFDNGWQVWTESSKSWKSTTAPTGV